MGRDDAGGSEDSVSYILRNFGGREWRVSSGEPVVSPDGGARCERLERRV